jgi:hypothetical protein
MPVPARGHDYHASIVGIPSSRLHEITVHPAEV